MFRQPGARSCARAIVAIASATVALAQEPSTQPAGTRATGSPLQLGYAEEQPRKERPGCEEVAEEELPGFWIFNRPAHVGPMISDRPGFSDSFALVPRGYQHLEFGYTFLYEREGSTRTTNNTVGEFSLRTGLTDDFELRIKWAGYSFTESLFPDSSRWSGRRIMSNDHDGGWTDMSIGFKLPLLTQDGLVPNLSVIPAISLPTGTGSRSTGGVDPEVRLVWNYALSNKWTVYGVGLAGVLSDDQGRFFQSGASLATAYSFTNSIGGFVEYYGLYPSARGSDCQHNIDFGPVFLINDNLQIDIRAGFGLNEEAPDVMAGIGFCFRF